MGRLVLGAIAPPPTSDDDAPTLDTALGERSGHDTIPAVHVDDPTLGEDHDTIRPGPPDESSDTDRSPPKESEGSDKDGPPEDPRETESQRMSDGETDLGNVLDMVERGPSAPLERALVSAFAVAGYASLASPDAGWFVRNAERVARDSNLSWFGFVDALLKPELAAEVWSELASRTESESDPFPTARARNAGRIAWLLASKSQAAADAVQRLTSNGSDPWVTALTGVRPPVRMWWWRVARSGRPLKRGWMFVRWVTGVALLSWLVRGVLSLLGTQDTGEIRLVAGGIRFRRTTMFLGRMVRDRDVTLTNAALASVGREVRYPMIHTLVGLMGLAIGLLAGSVFVVDGVRSGETILLLIAGVAVGLGVGLDLGLDVLIPGHRGLVRLDVACLPRRVIRLENVPIADADRLVEVLRMRLAAGKTNR